MCQRQLTREFLTLIEGPAEDSAAEQSDQRNKTLAHPGGAPAVVRQPKCPQSVENGRWHPVNAVLQGASPY